MLINLVSNAIKFTHKGYVKFRLGSEFLGPTQPSLQDETAAALAGTDGEGDGEGDGGGEGGGTGSPLFNGLGLMERQRYWVCHVIDTGIGIPKERLGRLFTKFSQVRERGKCRVSGRVRGKGWCRCS